MLQAYAMVFAVSNADPGLRQYPALLSSLLQHFSCSFIMLFGQLPARYLCCPPPLLYPSRLAHDHFLCGPVGE